ncbi:BQ2448_6968 [Microbotryum intermedium]|uniref:BQ2448_6968 protein n=1 Tax=Microbotryum intermedium TaxID=269621 RepID=A0A238FLZ2_9BASI|nr:BQ2448_6968 [Microbotryum intermedium]
MIFENCMPPAITQSRFDPSHLVGGTHAIGAKVIWDQLDSVKPFKSTISDTNTRLSNVEVNGERDAAYIKLSRKAFAGSERPAIKSAHDFFMFCGFIQGTTQIGDKWTPRTASPNP